MLELEDTIQFVLQTGETLEFEAFDMLAIPSFTTDILVAPEVSVYRVEQQIYNFQVSTKDCVENEIEADDSFTMADNSYNYSFKLKVRPIPSHDGWSRISADYLGREEL